jgi:protein-L-isoaspartate(D-aspartate) O-methyltransferase
MFGRPEEENFTNTRLGMVENHLKRRGISDKRVLDVFSRMPREKFVPENFRERAYFDGPLSIGQGQTISQPYIVALMTEQLEVGDDDIVLEVGTGSGYQAAILSRLAKKVYTIDRFESLSRRGQRVIEGLGIDNVEFEIGDGSCGYPGDMEFDKIMITAAVPTIPEPLVGQLKKGGIIVAPVGGKMAQNLVKGIKTEKGLEQSLTCGVRFVRLVGEYGFDH